MDISGKIVDVDGTVSGKIATVEATVSGRIISVPPVVSGTVTSQIIPDTYEGEYVVIPKTTVQVLPTKHKNMRDDVTVMEVPYVETANEYGITVSIVS